MTGPRSAGDGPPNPLREPVGVPGHPARPLEDVLRRLRDLPAGPAGAPARQAAAQNAGGTLLPGSSIGRYRIVSEIGRGGMGIVYLAEHQELKLRVALKVLPLGPFVGREALLRFEREAQAAADLAHPAIAHVHDCGREPSFAWYAMEYVEGVPLSSWMRTVGRPFREVLRILEGAARGVHYAHLRGVIHRDLTPANILVDPHGRPRVIDFGLAKFVGDGRASLGATHTGQVFGTPQYMAPEQAAGRVREVDLRADVYALGAILFEAATGRCPFVGESMIELLRRIVEEEAPPPSRVRPGVPSDVDAVALKCLEKDPDRRYGSAGDLADDLARIRRGEAVAARPRSAAYLLRKSIGRHRAATAIGALAAVSLCVVVVGAHARLLRERDAARGSARAALLARDEAVAARTEADESLRRLRIQQEVFGHLQRARDLESQGGSEAEILEAYAEAVAVDPSDTRIFLQRGLANLRRGNHRAADADLTQVLRVDPSNREALAYRGSARLEGALPGALEDLRAVASAGGETPETYLARAQIARINGRYEEAVLIAREGAERYPNATMCILLGDCHWFRQDAERAAEAYAWATRLAPHRAEAWYMLGKCERARGKTDEAQRWFAVALRIRPRLARVLIARSDLLLDIGHPQEALADAQTVIEDDPDHPMALYLRGVAMARLDRWGEAAADLDRYLDLLPSRTARPGGRWGEWRDDTDGTAYLVRGVSLAMLRRHMEALVSLSCAIEQYERLGRPHPNLKAGYEFRGRSHLALSRCREAAEDCGRALEIDPTLRMSWLTRGAARFQLQDWTGADADYTEALRLEPGDATALCDRGSVRAMLGRPDDALADYSRAVELAPANAGILLARARFHVSQRRLSEAQADLDRALALAPGIADDARYQEALAAVR